MPSGNLIKYIFSVRIFDQKLKTNISAKLSATDCKKKLNRDSITFEVHNIFLVRRATQCIYFISISIVL